VGFGLKQDMSSSFWDEKGWTFEKSGCIRNFWGKNDICFEKSWVS